MRECNRPPDPSRDESRDVRCRSPQTTASAVRGPASVPLHRDGDSAAPGSAAEMSDLPSSSAGVDPMRIVLVTGIHPPDIGGPATHIADLAAELGERGHEITVLTLTDDARPVTPARARAVPPPLGLVGPPRRGGGVARAGPAPLRPRVRHRAPPRCRRRRPPGPPPRHREDRRRSGLGARHPVGAHRRGFERFQARIRAGPAGPADALRARLVGAPRRFRARAGSRPRARRDGVAGARAGDVPVSVVPNGVRLSTPPAPGPRRDGELHAVFVGRLVDHKRVDVLVDAVTATPGVHLEIVGRGSGAGRARAAGEPSTRR